MNTQTESPTRLLRRGFLIARLAWLPFTLTCLLSALSLVFLALSWATPVPDTWGFRGDAMLLALVFGGIGFLLARRHPQNPIGWLLLLAGLINSILEFCVEYATYAMLTTPGELPYGTLAAWIASWLWVIGIAILIYVFLLFPTGRLPSARWRPVAGFFVGAFGLLTFVFMIRPGPLYFAPYLDNPFAVPVAYRVLSPIPVATAAAVLLVGISVILRLRRAEGVERQQLKWFAYAATLRAIFGMSESVAEAVGLKGTSPKFYEYLSVALWIAIAVAIAFAILWYRLWDIDVLINRTLVYGALTASVVGLYGLTVGWLSMILQTQNDLLAGVFAVLVIAFLFQPLRQLLQDIADRFVPVPRVMVSDPTPLPVPQTKQERDDAVIDGRPNPALRGRWLLAARLIWVAVFIVLTALYTFGFVAVRDTFSTLCEEENCTLRQQIRHTEAGDQIMSYLGPPIGYADPLRSDQVKALDTLGLTLDQYGWLAALQLGLPVLLYLLIAVGLFWRKSDDWMVLLVSMTVATFPLHDMPLPFTAVVRQPAWGWVVAPAGWVALAAFMIFPLIFPNGQFVPRWTRWKVLFDLAFGVINVLFPNFIWNTLIAMDLFFVYLLTSLCTSIYAQVYRYRLVASPTERQQIKWVVVGLVGFISISAGILLPLNQLLISQAGNMDPARALVVSTIPDILFRAVSLFIPISIAISVLRYRLWDIDIIISRTLVYGALTASVVGLYVLIVGGFGMLFQMQSNLPGIIIAILSIAFLFQPLRRRFQAVVNRFMPIPQAIISQPSARPILQTKQEQNVAVIDSGATTALRGRWLILARLAWVIMFLTLTAICVSGFFAVHDVLSTVCEAEACTLREQSRRTESGEQIVRSAGPPVGFADRLRPDQVEELDTLGFTVDQYGWLGALQLGLPALVLLLIAAGLFWWKSDDWMVLFASIMVATFPIHNMPLAFTLMVRQPAWEWIVNSASIVALSCLLIFPLVFPTGQFVPRWTRWMALYNVTAAIIASFLGSDILEVFRENLGRVFIGFIVVIPFGIGVYAQLYRYFRVARPAERQQFKWVVVGLVGTLVIQFGVLIPLNALLTSPAFSADPTRALVLSAIPDTLWQLNNLLIAVCIVISVLRYRLWDVDIFINRSLVYGALIVTVIALYMIVVGVAGTLFQSIGNTLLAIIATGLIAVLFHPLRQRLQRGINRLMYGERDEPYTALSRLGRQLEASLAPGAILPTVVTTVRDVLRLPYVAIYLQQDSQGYKIVAESASPLLRIENGRIRVPGMEREGRCFPLIHQGETLGYIVLGPRAPNEAFSSMDLSLLDDLAPQVGVAVHAVRLTADLQRSRERLVLAREEERRRLRRDLHDDLGPTLASLGLTAGTAAELISTDPTKAASLVKDLQTEIRATVGNIRRLVYDLRPPSLDELGLLAAVRERAAQYSAAPDGFHITVDAPAELPVLPAAVEVAAYRIVQEALENVSRHSHARLCVIRFASHNGLEIEITDDGIGLPTNITPGVGLRSMRERAEELGGSLTIESGRNRGTRLRACLPFGELDGNIARIDRG